MKKSNQITLILAFLWFLVKYILFQTGYSLSHFQVSIFANILFLTLALVLGFYFYKKENKNTSFSNDIKKSIQIGSKYVIFMILFMWLYFAVFDRTFFDRKKVEQEIAYTSIDFEELQKNNPSTFSDVSKAEYIKQMMERDEIYLRTGTQLLLAFLALLILSIIYSFIIVYIMRKLPAQ